MRSYEPSRPGEDAAPVAWPDVARAALLHERPAPISTSAIARTFEVESRGRRAILKHYAARVPRYVAAARDPRVGAVTRLLPIAPHFSPLARWHHAVGEAVGLQVPALLAEGALGDGSRYAVTTRLDGHAPQEERWRRPAELREISRAIGEVAAQLHAAPLPPDATCPEPDDWLDRAAEALHLAADLIDDARRPAQLHARLHALVEAAREIPLGPVSVVHGDLHPANLLLDERGRPRALLDLDLTCCAPAAVDLRHLRALDADAFLDGYGRFDGTPAQARWFSEFAELLWSCVGLIADRAQAPDDAAFVADIAHLTYVLQNCERLAGLAPPADSPRTQRSSPQRTAALPAPDVARVTIVVPTWNHCETTTVPCLQALRWFTDLPYRVVFVDNDSRDGTRATLDAAAKSDPRVELVRAPENLGWARGTLAGLERLQPQDSHVLLLNSDVLVTPGWLRKMLAHLQAAGDDTLVIPDEYPALAGARGALAPEHPIEPGTAVAAPPPALRAVLELHELVERARRGVATAGHPSGFCLLFARARTDFVRDYLTDFDRYHAGELDAAAAWSRAGLRCVVAEDTFVFHARGGSGGYYRYERDRAL